MGLLSLELLPSCVSFHIFLHNLAARIEKTHENLELYHSSSSYNPKRTQNLVNIK